MAAEALGDAEEDDAICAALHAREANDVAVERGHARHVIATDRDFTEGADFEGRGLRHGRSLRG